MKKNLDYHVHPGFSIDAEPCSIDEYCRQALAAGVDEICFTPHLEVDPVRRHRDWFVRMNGERHPMNDLRWLNRYFAEIDRARYRYASTGPVIKAGLEVGFDRGLERTIENITTAFPFDFVLGSVHCLEHHAISSWEESRAYFPTRTLAQVTREYFTTLDEAVQSRLFDCIGHLDLYCRYGHRFFGPAVFSAYRGQVEPIFKQMALCGTGLEINTSSLRRGLQDFHPAREILILARDQGIRTFTVGSDAHRPADLGDHTVAALDLLHNLHLQAAIFSARRPVAAV
ncbi:histidinol-phosphatase [Desulfotomaculum copahuensis]|uniref:Histidinol-phosphatase n=1 Tax=Desulfotomaculum copahuensis TaxID=1838280 RepID=A0A1B7LC61_9FIRM|nr:histidinol-phosphatase [Desulfotomaculum copahuensis]OAT80275.1 histidinol phosphate phosphatase [Desulfotomaculum copahuensis]